MIKKYVLDTNVILVDPLAFTRFGDNEVIIPITVIEELDNHKTDMRLTGQAARHFFKYLDKYLDDSSIKKGIVVNAAGGTLRVDVRYTIESHDVDLPLDYSIMDNRIINCAYINDAVIVTNDRACRVKAAAYNIHTEVYKNDRVDVDDNFTGWSELWVEPDIIDQIYKEKFISSIGYEAEFYPNKFFVLKDMYNEKHSALVSYNDVMKEFILLLTDNPIMGITGRNMEQHFALSALCDPDIKLVCLIGKAGCGKSLMALAAGLNAVTQGEKDYKKLLVYRPIVPMGNDIGYLPGTQEEKLGPWMQAISDNIDFIMGDINAEDRPKIKKPKKSGSPKNDIPVLGEKDAGKVPATTELTQMGFLEMAAMTYIRGRSIPNQYMIVDEAQNLTPHEIKTVITRAGEGTKIILTGDPSQIDASYLDATNNGLSYVSERSKFYAHAATIKFTKSERSELAEWAANTL